MVAIAAVGMAVLAMIMFGGGANKAGAQAYTTVSGVQISGVSLNPGLVVSVGDARPTIQGGAPAGSTVSIRITPGDITFTAVAGADGSFRTQVPSALGPGTFTIFINGQSSGSFSVAAAVPKAPATGSGELSGDTGSQTQFVLFALAIVLLAVGVAASFRRRFRRR